MEPHNEQEDVATKNKKTTFFGTLFGAAATVPN